MKVRCAHPLAIQGPFTCIVPQRLTVPPNTQRRGNRSTALTAWSEMVQPTGNQAARMTAAGKYALVGHHNTVREVLL